MVESHSSREVFAEPVKQTSLVPDGHGSLKRRTWFWLLLVVHLGMGLTFSIWSAVEGTISFVFEFLLVVPALGIISAQTSLLGFCVAFSPAAWWHRPVGLIVGGIYLEAMFRLGGQDGDGFNWLATISLCGIAIIFSVIRWRLADLQETHKAASHADREGLRFSVRGLMLFTLIVAAALVGVRELREHAPAGPNFLMIAIWGLCFVVTGLASVWAGLGLARPRLRSALVLLIAGVLGGLFVYGIDPPVWDTYFYIVSIMVLQVGTLIATLLVVRSCGYRLVRKSASDVG